MKRPRRLRPVQKGLGEIEVDGVMADAATARLMRNILDKADLTGM